MNNLYIRAKLAELGVEKTPDEAQEITNLFEKIIDDLTFKKFNLYRNITPERLISLAKRNKMSVTETRDAIEILVTLGNKKFSNGDI